MVFEYLFFCLLLLIILTGTAAFIIYAYYRKCRRMTFDKEKLLADQTAEIERQNRIIQNFSSLYDGVVLQDKVKTEFFTNIVHELKTPISVILGAIQLTEAKRQEAPNMDSVIKINCYRLLRLTNNLLDFVKADSGYLKLNLKDCNLAGIVEEIAQSVVPYSQKNQIALTFDTTDEEIITAVDVEKIERIVLNLLSNAIKFTSPGGTIEVLTGVKGDRAFISVKDSGIGIPKDKQEEIFERFQQVGSEVSRGKEGTGIGLSLVRSYVELHQGSIRIVSEKDCGSEFIIDLPLKRVGQDGERITSVSEINGNIAEAINIEFSNIRPIAS